jgi:Zn-finger nucleic acid-binding protein
MRTYERNGINIDQCTECRGLFLDRGELEHLVKAEDSFYAAPEPAPRQEAQRQEAPRHSHDSFQYKGQHHKKRKKHFLEELFD